ncbi:virulence protein PagD [Salmonella enterica subsp. enterica serovar Dublin]
MKHHAFMLWSLLIFSFHVLASSGHCSGLQQASWDIFIYDFGSKTPQPPTNTDKKQARQISSPSCPTTKPMMSAPVNDAYFLQNIMLFIYNGAERLLLAIRKS